MSREAFDQAVGFFLETVRQVPADRWEAPALGVWSVRELVGHTSRAMTLVDQYATVGAGGRTGFGTSEEIAERGKEAGRLLGDDPAGAVDEIAKRVRALVASLPDDHPLETPVGTRGLVAYMATRVSELTIHTIDLASVIGVHVEPPAECILVTLYSLADAAVREGLGTEVAFALTGRTPLPAGFSVLP